MKGSVRTQLRCELASLLGEKFTIGTVKSGRYYNARDGQPFVLIYFSEGQAETESLAGISESQLLVDINLPEGKYDDDDLDTWGDELASVINNDMDINMDDQLAGIIYQGFEYPPLGEIPFISLNLIYTVHS